MTKRSKSVPAKAHAEILTISNEVEKDLKKSVKKGKAAVKSSLDNRPPFNLDTKIEGYDDVDENGRIRKRHTAAPGGKNKIDQDELNKVWLSSLRDSFHDSR